MPDRRPRALGEAAHAFAPFDFESLRRPGPVSLVEVPVTGAWQLGALEQLGLDVTEDISDGRARVMLYGDRDRTTLARTGFGFTVVHPDMAAVERAARAGDRRWAARVGRSALPTAAPSTAPTRMSRPSSRRWPRSTRRWCGAIRN